jgi:hypothetical protein
MNFRRRHSRDHGARAHSSDWRYPQLEKGKDQRGKPSTKRHISAFEEDLARWMKDPEFAEAYAKARESLDNA